MSADSLMRHRDAVAMLPAIVVLALLATASVKQIVKLKDNSEPMTVSLYEEPPPEDLPPPPKPQPRVIPPEATPPRPQPQQVVDPQPAPVVTQPAEAISAPVATAPVQTPTPPVPPVAAPASTPPARHSANESLEATYVAKLRTYLNSIKRYPTSREARQQHPQGKVRMWLELARDGTLRNLGVEETSGSMILDGAAQSTVRQGSYPAFPDEMWAGNATHRFAVTLEYLLDG
jgi:periplasmic protein TonB